MYLFAKFDSINVTPLELRYSQPLLVVIVIAIVILLHLIMKLMHIKRRMHNPLPLPFRLYRPRVTHLLRPHIIVTLHTTKPNKPSLITYC